MVLNGVDRALEIGCWRGWSIRKGGWPAAWRRWTPGTTRCASTWPRRRNGPSDCAGWRVQDVYGHMASIFHQVADPSVTPTDTFHAALRALGHLSGALTP